MLNVGLDQGEEASRVNWMPAHTPRSRIGEARCWDGFVVADHMWAAKQLADPHSVFNDLAVKSKLITQFAVYVEQLTQEAKQHRLHGGAVVSDALKLEACVARKSALRKQQEEEVRLLTGERKVAQTPGLTKPVRTEQVEVVGAPPLGNGLPWRAHAAEAALEGSQRPVSAGSDSMLSWLVTRIGSRLPSPRRDPPSTE